MLDQESVFENTSNIVQYIQDIEQHMSQVDFFSREDLANFREGISKHILHVLQQQGSI